MSEPSFWCVCVSQCRAPISDNNPFKTQAMSCFSLCIFVCVPFTTFLSTFLFVSHSLHLGLHFCLCLHFCFSLCIFVCVCMPTPTCLCVRAYVRCFPNFCCLHIRAPSQTQTHTCKATQRYMHTSHTNGHTHNTHTHTHTNTHTHTQVTLASTPFMSMSFMGSGAAQASVPSAAPGPPGVCMCVGVWVLQGHNQDLSFV